MQKDKILNLYYIEHLKVKEIAEKSNTSSAYITKIIKKDLRYIKEKEYRKSISEIKRKKAKNDFMKCKREIQKIDENYEFVRKQHNQASKELSTPNHMSDIDFRRWNSSAYNYNPSKKRYEFDTNLVRAADVPKYVSMKGFF